MTFTTEKLDDEPIIVTILSQEFRVEHDMPKSDAAGRTILDASDEPMFNVVDLRTAQLNFQEIIQGTHEGTRGIDPIWHHPKIHQTIFVTESQLVKLAVKSMQGPAYANARVAVCETLDEALTLARSQIEESNP